MDARACLPVLCAPRTTVKPDRMLKIHVCLLRLCFSWSEGGRALFRPWNTYSGESASPFFGSFFGAMAVRP